MTTSQPFPIRIGRITFKDRKGPVTSLHLKRQVKVVRELMAAAAHMRAEK